MELVHLRIAHIAGPLASIAGQKSLDGYLSGLKEAGIEYDQNLWLKQQSMTVILDMSV